MNDLDVNISQRIKEKVKAAIDAPLPYGGIKESANSSEALAVVTCMLVGCNALNQKEFLEARSKQARSEMIYIAMARLIAKRS